MGKATPGDSKGVEGLRLLAGPYICAFNREEGFELVRDNLISHDVVEYCADSSPNHLHGECNAWR